MSKSRYIISPIINGNQLSTWNLPITSNGYKKFDLLKGIATYEYIWKRGDRMDILAELKLGDPGYWWVICLANKIGYPFIAPGIKLRLPFNVEDILERILP